MSELITLNSGRQLFFTRKGSGPGLLCLHGLGGGGYFFAGLANALQDRWSVTALDLPGCGLSPRPPEGFSFKDSARVVEELVVEKLEQPVTLLGHSMGTIVALEAAARGTLSIERMIFVGGLPEPTPEARMRLKERADEVRRNGMTGVGKKTMPIIFSRSSLSRIPDKVAMYERLLEMNDSKSYAEAAEALSSVSALAAVSKISSPCLALTGAEDQYAPPESVRAFVEHLSAPVEYWEMSECGHMPFFEDPEVFNKIIRDFLNR